MNKFFGKIYGPLVVIVDVLMLVDLATDLVKKYKEHKAKKQSTVSETEMPEPEKS